MRVLQLETTELGTKQLRWVRKDLILWIRDVSTIWVRNVLAAYETTEGKKRLVTLQSKLLSKAYE